MWFLQSQDDQRGRHERISSEDDATAPIIADPGSSGNGNVHAPNDAVPSTRNMSLRSTGDPSDESETTSTTPTDHYHPSSDAEAGTETGTPNTDPLAPSQAPSPPQPPSTSIPDYSRTHANDQTSTGADDNSTGVVDGSDSTHLSPELSILVSEMDAHQRNSSACMMILMIILLRLWLEVLLTGDVYIVLIALFFTGYMIAWKKHRMNVDQEYQDSIDEWRMREAGQSHANGAEEEEGSGTNRWSSVMNAGRDARRARRRMRREMQVAQMQMQLQNGDFDFTTSDHIDLEMLGFHGQLAYAIMESQRHILETGGYGRPGGEDENQLAGVTEEAKNQWEDFQYSKNHAKVLECEDLKPHKNELPSCCICLCEYEEGEDLVQLACDHIFHKECILGWTKNHVRCPLCNADLEHSSSDNGSDSIV
mmetsp:Transcript_14421/g.21182  ORF Transcript_14421/g.21182 Transcript_14421/m.21182 type:complete len:422 (-) Transcript_14421:45-1310(-)|eukprot:CAMPEP_0197247688 /NCGR_PEP_ID=MMETSP1429-20130617/31031_1 /TAXON_ID=49237 /ORGANISM="Chaetoceros  sp., Strain UNC1202" /LENGTH=421 /DNA_ID=CAMNT_0042708655 /DNA_START=117 /DNA_END=1382 /DNA_ORIENTATION=+